MPGVSLGEQACIPRTTGGVMAKQSPELGRLIDGVRDAVREREHVAELARGIDARVAVADANVSAAHDALDQYFLTVRAPVVALADPPAADEPAWPEIAAESEAEALRRKVAAGLIDEAPCTSRQLHEPHQWDDELGAVACLGVQPVEDDE